MATFKKICLDQSTVSLSLKIPFLSEIRNKKLVSWWQNVYWDEFLSDAWRFRHLYSTQNTQIDVNEIILFFFTDELGTFFFFSFKELQIEHLFWEQRQWLGIDLWVVEWSKRLFVQSCAMCMIYCRFAFPLHRETILVHNASKPLINANM